MAEEMCLERKLNSLPQLVIKLIQHPRGRMNLIILKLNRPSNEPLMVGGRGWCLWGGGRPGARGGDNCIPRSLSVIDSRDTNMMGALMMFTNRERQQLLFTETEDPSTLAPDSVLSVTKLRLPAAAYDSAQPPTPPVTVSRLPGPGTEKRRKNYQRSVSIQMHLSSVFNTNPCHRKFLEMFLTILSLRKSHPGLLFLSTGSWLNTFCNL